MALGFDQAHVLHADALQFGGQHLGGVAAIALVLGQRGDGRNAQQGLQFIEKAGMVLAGIGNGGRRHRSLLAADFGQVKSIRRGVDENVPGELATVRQQRSTLRG